MVTRIFSLDEPRRPDRGINNIWYENRNKDQVIVFVHGILSDSQGCWYRKPTEGSSAAYWPDLLLKDGRFSEFSIYLGGYYTDVDSGPYEVSDCAEELMGALRRPDKVTRRSVLDHKTIVFVCHSMGGIVVRYMLTARPWEFRDSRIGLALIASPSAGSNWANRLEFLLQYFKQEQGIQLRWGNWSLKDLDERFRIVLQDGGIPQLLGSEACENKFVVHGKWIPIGQPVVTRDSAGIYFGRVRMLPNCDHFSCVKPNSTGHPAYEFLVDFCHRLSVNRTIPLRPNPVSPPQSSPQIILESSVGSKPFGCGAFHWDLKIDEEGDAYNEMAYEGITLNSESPWIWPLPPGEVQSGHMSPYELLRDDRTSEGVILEPVDVSNPMKVRMNVRFSNRPTELRPARFCISCYDWNIFSMNMEEFRQKPGWREDGLDFVEKLVPSAWNVFSMVIRFPEQIAFAKTPFFEIYEPAEGFDENRNDTLTSQYQHCFYYSRLLQEAVLLVQHPPHPFSYRISWLVGESPIGATSPLIPRQRQRQRNFAQKLLRMRRTLEGPENNKTEAQQLEEVVNSLLASVAEYVQETLEVVEPLDSNSLDINLMILDEDLLETSGVRSRVLPVLRIVAGTSLADIYFHDLKLFVGNGNAGRAWKRRMARVFDHTEKDPKRHIYVAIPGSPSHCFLVSIPLIDPGSSALLYGILNIGTVSEHQAEVLRSLGTTEHILELTRYAQAFVLKRLLEALRM